MLMQVKYRRNLITQLLNAQGQQLFNHDEKASLIWESFKERLGTSNFTGMNFDLPSLFGITIDLGSLIAHFTHNEIDTVVKICLQTNPQAQMASTQIFLRNAGLLFVEIFIICVMLSIQKIYAYKVSMAPISLSFLRMMVL